MKKALNTLFFLPFVGLILGQLGWFHTAFDSIGVFREALLFCSLASVLYFFLRRKWFILGPLVGYCVFLGFTVWPQGIVTGVPSSNMLTVYQKNILFNNYDREPLVDDIVKSGAGFVTLQEVSPKNMGYLDLLKRQYQSSNHCRFATVGGVAVLSSFPMVSGTKGCGAGVAYMQVETSNGPYWIVSVHLYWPWPHGQEPQADRILAQLQKLSGPMIIGGDFNMVTWSHRLSEFEKTLDVTAVGGVHRSYDLGGSLGLPFDHVLHTRRAGIGDANLRPKFGSDHRGILARLPL